MIVLPEKCTPPPAGVTQAGFLIWLGRLGWTDVPDHEVSAALGRIAVVDDGRIVELESHRELVAAGGAYARLWELWRDERARDAL